MPCSVDLTWRPRAELLPEMSPIFVAMPKVPTFQVATYDASDGKWKTPFGFFSAVIMDSSDFKFISVADALPPLPDLTSKSA